MIKNTAISSSTVGMLPVCCRSSLTRWACAQDRLINKYKTNHAVRLLDIWCRIRSYVGQSALLYNRKSHLQTMATYCDCSEGKLRAAIKELVRMKWIYMNDDCIKIHSEREIYRLCGLDYYRRIDRIFYKPEKIKDEKQTHYWIYLSDIADNRQRQAWVFTQKMLQTPETNQYLYSVATQRGIAPAQITSHAITIAQAMMTVYIDGFCRKEGEMHAFLVDNRPDPNRSVNGIGQAWGVAPTKVSYIKKKFLSESIGTIVKTGTITSAARSRNPHIHIAVSDSSARPKGALWNRNHKVTFQAICDDIRPRMDCVTFEKQLRSAA